MAHNTQVHYTPKRARTTNCPECGRQMHPASVRRHQASSLCKRGASRRGVRREGLTDAKGVVFYLRRAGVPITSIQTGVSRWGARRGQPIIEHWAPKEMVAVALAAEASVPHLVNIDDHYYRDGESVLRIVKHIADSPAVQIGVQLGMPADLAVKEAARELSIRLMEGTWTT